MRRSKRGFPLWLLFPLTVLSVLAVSLFTKDGVFSGGDIRPLLENGLVIVTLAGLLQFSLAAGRIKNVYHEETRRHMGRFFFVYLAAFACSFVFSFLPPAGWPFPIVFLALSLFSDEVTGMTAGVSLLAVTAMFAEGFTLSSLLLLLCCSTFTVTLFSHIEEGFRATLPVAASSVCLFAVSVCQGILGSGDRLSVTVFIIPTLNVMINALLMVVFLNWYSQAVVHKQSLKFMELNDQTCPLLIELRDLSEPEYFHAVHTAFFCTRIAEKLEADVHTCRAGGFYHHIGLLYGENTWDNIADICDEFEFPDSAYDLLDEYTNSKDRIVSKEAAILFLADTVVASVSYLRQKSAQAKPDYKALVSAIYDKRLQSPSLAHSKLSRDDIAAMKEIFIGEELYYDFIH